MDKYVYDENNGLWYEFQGDYYISCLELLDEKEEQHIGALGQQHLRYLKEYHGIKYDNLFTRCRLDACPSDIDKQK